MNTLYITIDDGPNTGYEQIQDAVIKANIPVSMFLVGQMAEARPDAVKKYGGNSLFEICNHSFNHANDHYKLFYESPEGVVKDMQKASDTLDKILGRTGEISPCRLPGRSVFRLPGLTVDDPYISKAQLKGEIAAYDAVHKAGFLIYGWDAEWQMDNHGMPVYDASTVIEGIDKRFASETYKPNKVIVLMHSQMFRTPQTQNYFAEFCNQAKDKYNLEHISQY